MKPALTVLMLAACAAAAEKDFLPLFDGRTLQGWQLVGGHGPGYVVDNGVLVCPEDGGGNLFTEKQYANFVFRFEFKLSPGGNNGIGIRSPLKGDAAYQGMEVQLIDDSADRYQDLKDWQRHGSIYHVFPARPGSLKPAGQWNSEEITARGRRITVQVNGKTVVDADLDTVKDPEILKRHPGLARTTGHIGFLGHGTRVEFRNIRIKELP